MSYICIIHGEIAQILSLYVSLSTINQYLINTGWGSRICTPTISSHFNSLRYTSTILTIFWRFCNFNNLSILGEVRNISNILRGHILKRILRLVWFYFWTMNVAKFSSCMDKLFLNPIFYMSDLENPSAFKILLNRPHIWCWMCWNMRHNLGNFEGRCIFQVTLIKMNFRNFLVRWGTSKTKMKNNNLDLIALKIKPCAKHVLWGHP